MISFKAMLSWTVVGTCAATLAGCSGAMPASTQAAPFVTQGVPARPTIPAHSYPTIKLPPHGPHFRRYFPLHDPGYGNPFYMTLGPDQKLWFTDFSDAIGTISAHRPWPYQFYLLPPSSPVEPRDIVAGPDGNLWATLYSGGIVKTTPSGQMTIYVTPHGAVKNIAAGPDGNLWFTEHDANLFGRITTDGSITEYPLDDIGVPNGIRAGPDGRLWICEQGEWTSSHVTPGRIVRVDTNGQIYGVYPLAPKAWQNVPEDIAVGKHQKLWFTEFYAPSQVTYYISSINQNGKIHEYLTLAGGGQYAGPGVPTLAADGNIWFSEEYAGQLGRVTSSGKITEFPLPQGSGSSYTFPYGVATDASGHNIWFADWQNKRLGLFAI